MFEDPLLLSDWFPVLLSTDLSDGQVRSVRLLGEDLVLWRSAGEARVARDLCIHRGTRLSLGGLDGEQLICPYHGWAYDREGRCVHIPAHPEHTPPGKARLLTYLTQEAYGLIWVCLESEAQAILPALPGVSDNDFTSVLSGPYTVQACATRIMENFLDVAHFPFVHAGILGDPDHARIPAYEVSTDLSGIRAAGIAVYQPDPYGTGSGDQVDYTYQVYRPLQASLSKAGKDGSRLSILLLLCPHDEHSTTVWFYSVYNAGLDLPPDEFDRYQTLIFLQDRPIVESQRPELLPLDLSAELHLRSDHLALAYRRWLKELGLRFGTIG